MEKKNINLVLVLCLAAGLAIGSTNTLVSAITMGVCVLVVSTLANLILRAFADCKNIAALIVITTLSAIVSLLVNAFVPAAFKNMNVYLSTLCVDLVVYYLIDFDVTTSLMASGKLTVILVLMGAVRELFGTGSIAGKSIGLLAKNTINVLASPAGGLLVLAIAMAIVNKNELLDFNEGFLKNIFANKKEGE